MPPKPPKPPVVRVTKKPKKKKSIWETLKDTLGKVGPGSPSSTFMQESLDKKKYGKK